LLGRIGIAWGNWRYGLTLAIGGFSAGIFRWFNTEDEP
jgi:hypothetical protein